MRRHFLTPRLLRDWLALFNRLLGNDTARRRARRSRRRVARPDAGTTLPGARPAQADRRLEPRPGLLRARRRRQRVGARGGGGLVTALRSLVAHHDVTWIASAMTDEDRAVAAEAAARRSTRRRATARRTGCGSSPTTRTPTTGYYNVVSNPTLWFLQHYLWDLAYAPDVDRGFHHAWDEGYVAVNRGFAEAVLEELEREPDAAVFFHDYHLYLAPRLVRERRPRRDARALRPHPVAAAGLLARAARADPPRDPRRAARERRRRLPHRPLARATSCAAATTSSGPTSTSRPGRVDSAADDARRRAADLGRPGGVRRACRERRACSRRSADRRGASGAARPSRRPHRPVEEHRARLPRVRALPRAHPELHGRVGDARAARPVAAGHPGVRGVPRRDPARGARGQRPLPAERLAADRPADRGQLPAVGRRVQAVRRAARQRDLRRA